MSPVSAALTDHISVQAVIVTGTYSYTALAVSSPVVTETITSTHCAYIHQMLLVP